MTTLTTVKWRSALCCFCALSTPLVSLSADFFYMDHDAFTGKYTGPVGSLVMSGDIETGDYDRLLTKIGEDSRHFLSQDKLILASTAGDATEAIKIARLVQALHIEVSVGPLTGRCSDVCFLIYAAADQRGADAAGLIGIQGATPDDAAAEGEFLRESEVPATLAAQAMRPPSRPVYWLNDADEANLNSRSPAFIRYLMVHCHWNEETERDVRIGKRPFADMKDMWACRSRVTQSDAATALAAALKDRSEVQR